jgi:hypothetical protein
VRQPSNGLSLQGYLVLSSHRDPGPRATVRGYPILRYYDSELARTDEDLRGRARELALTVDRDLQGQRNILQALSIAQFITNRNLEAFHGQATRIRDFTGLNY